jgi:hypothetical protein
MIGILAIETTASNAGKLLGVVYLMYSIVV